MAIEKKFILPRSQVDTGQPVLIGVHLLERMRSAGVPVLGAIWPMGVTSGSLTYTYDDMFDEITIVWRDA